MQFRDIIGQDELKQRLRESVLRQHIAHAQLFCGAEGVGALPLALAYARFIHCTNRTDQDACGVCASCVKYDKLIHPDLHFVFPIYKSKTKDVCDEYLTDWRSMLREEPYFSLNQWMSIIGSENAQGMIYAKESSEILRKLSLKTYEAEYKIMIIWLPEKMGEECANKLLKLLEEPPPKTLFILVAEQTERILQTILSRSQRVNVRPIAQEVMVQVLQAKYNLDLQHAQAVAHISGGSYLKAVETIRLNEDNQLFFDYFVRYMRMAYSVANMKSAENPALKFDALRDLKLISDEISTLGREKQKQFLEYCQHFLRENFILNIRIPSLSYLTEKEQAFANRFAPFIHQRNVEGFITAFEEASVHIESNVYAKMVFFDLALRAIVLLRS